MERLSTSPPRWLDAVVLLAVATVIAVGGYAAWCRTPLLWDGSYQLAETLRAGSPYAYLSRFHTRLLWLPVTWLMPVTDNVRLLQAVYGLPFLLAPAVALATCWWFIRRHLPTLMVWAAIGILATPLPGQIFVINDSVFQQHLFWPVFLGLLVPMTRGQKLVWAVLAVFQFVHQIGLLLMAGAAVTTLVLAWLGRRSRPTAELSPSSDSDRSSHQVRSTTLALPTWRPFWVAAALVLLIAAKVWWTSTPGTPFYDSYAAREATWQFAKDRWWKSVWGHPFNGLRMVWLGAGIICLQAWLFTRQGRESTARLCSAMTLLVLVVGVLNWTTWADDPIAWGGAIEYRRWLVPMTLPIFALVAIEAWWRASRAGRHVDIAPVLPLRAAVILLLTGVYAIVIGRQSAQVEAMTARLEAELAASPSATLVLPADHWARGTPLDHWSLGWHTLVLQGKRPTAWMAPTDLPSQDLSALDASPPRVPISKFTALEPEPGPTGWFDLRAITRGDQR